MPLFSLSFSTEPRVDTSIFRFIYMNDYYNKWRGYYHIYTNGSRQNSGTGAAFYDPITKHSEQIRLPDKASIFSAETSAIYFALKYCSKIQEKKILILSDSQSVIMTLKSNEKQLFKISPYIINTI